MTTEPSQEIPSFKIVLLGETAVGKSCLISRYVNNQFLSNFVPTMGGCFSTKEITYDELNKKKINLQIWDTAGQEKYRSITKMFYKDASAAILVYDITREESFLEIKNFWFKEVKENSSEDLVVALVGNKKDLYEYEEVKKPEIEQYAKEHGAIFKETSAKEGTGVDEVFRLIGLKLISPEFYDKVVNQENSRQHRLKSKSSMLITNNTHNNSQFVAGGLQNSTMLSEGGKKKCC